MTKEEKKSDGLPKQRGASEITPFTLPHYTVAGGPRGEMLLCVAAH